MLLSGYAVRLQDGSGFCGRTEELKMGGFFGGSKYRTSAGGNGCLEDVRH